MEKINSLFDPLMVREVLNAAAFPLSVILFVMIILHLWGVYRIHGKNWRTEPGSATACALSWIFFAESVRAGCAWLILKHQNDGYLISERSQLVSSLILMLAGFVLVCSLLRCVFIFTPDELGNSTWIAATAAMLAFVVFTIIT